MDIKKRLGILREILSFFWERKMYWMIPIVIMLLIFGFLIFFVQSSAVSPFIYTLF